MDFVKFISLLDSRQLQFARADRLGDSWEGSLPAPLASLRGTPEESEGPSNTWNLSHSGEHVRYRTYVSCWHESPHESAAMWRLYGGESRSIAITTTYAAFKASFDNGPQDHHPIVSRVHYVDYATASFSVNNGFLPFIHKRQSFEHEREVRAMFPLPPTSDADRDERELDVLARTRPEIIGVPVNLTHLVGEIRVDPLAPPWFTDLIRSVTRRYDLSAPVGSSAISSSPMF